MPIDCEDANLLESDPDTLHRRRDPFSIGAITGGYEDFAVPLEPAQCIRHADRPRAYTSKARSHMTEDDEDGGTSLVGLFLGYLAKTRPCRVEEHRISQEARTARHKSYQEARVAIVKEREATRRVKSQAEVSIAREREITHRDSMRWNAKVAISHEQRRAFESLCNSLKDSLRSGDITLDNIRHQFGSICQMIVEQDLLPDERGMLLHLLNDLLDQQKQISAGNKLAIAHFRPEKYLDAD